MNQSILPPIVQLGQVSPRDLEQWKELVKGNTGS